MPPPPIAVTRRNERRSTSRVLTASGCPAEVRRVRRQLLWRATSLRRTQEEIAAVFQRHALAVGLWRAALRAISLDDDLDAGREIGFAQAAPKQRRGTAGFNRPVDDFAAGLEDVDVDPAMRVHPLHLRQHALELHGLV